MDVSMNIIVFFISLIGTSNIFIWLNLVGIFNELNSLNNKIQKEE